ncbi:MAG TPA: hypothetical protein EYN69_04520 [Flavobacteriales bacterium]|nr:hypothetical protein [Flavobacteriales bacterium]
MRSGFNLNQILSGKIAAGVEIIFAENGEQKFNLSILQEEKSKLEIINAGKSFSELEILKKELDADIPINLVFNGRGLIHKMVQVDDGDNDTTLLQKVFPNAKSDDFYFEKEHSGNGSARVSVLRKDKVDEILEAFKKMGLFVVSLSFGPFGLNRIQHLLSTASGSDYSINVGPYQLQYAEGKLRSFESGESTATEQVSIGGELISQEAVIPFAAAFGYLFSGIAKEPVSSAIIISNREEFTQKRIFKMAGWGVLGFFLVALMANFFLFSYYSSINQDLDSRAFMGRDQITHLSTLKKDVESKEALLQKTGLLKTSRTSLYADKIAQSVPRSIVLTGMSINPANKRMDEKQAPVFSTGEIILIGKSSKSTQLNEWVKALKSQEWVAEVVVEDYSSTGRGASGEFVIGITIE